MCVEIKDPFKQIHTHTRWLFLYEFDGKMMMTMMMMMYREKFFFSFRKKKDAADVCSSGLYFEQMNS